MIREKIIDSFTPVLRGSNSLFNASLSKIRRSIFLLFLVPLLAGCDPLLTEEDPTDFLNQTTWSCTIGNYPVRIFFDNGTIKGIDNSNSFLFIPVKKGTLLRISEVTYVSEFTDTGFSKTEATYLVRMTDSSMWPSHISKINNGAIQIFCYVRGNDGFSTRISYMFKRCD